MRKEDRAPDFVTRKWIRSWLLYLCLQLWHCLDLTPTSIFKNCYSSSLQIKTDTSSHHWYKTEISGICIPYQFTMSTIENEVKEQRRLSLLLWKAIDSQLELEKAADKLMKDVYEDLAIIGSGGGSGEDVSMIGSIWNLSLVSYHVPSILNPSFLLPHVRPFHFLMQLLFAIFLQWAITDTPVASGKQCMT